MHNKKHLKCTLWKTLWGLATLLVVLTALNLLGVVVLAHEPLACLAFAAVLGILAIPIKLDCASCGRCSV